MRYYLATRPEDAVGEPELWEKATSSLVSALKKENLEYVLDEGGGAFYGPKIDIKIKDALGREWQMTTVQFDFNMSKRFDIKYIGEDGKEHQPFMVHRALLGSIERFFGVLIEHFGGAFPLWLAPVQVAVLPVSEHHFDYAAEVYEKLKGAGIKAELDKRNEKIGYKIRSWETEKIPYMLIIGEKEKTAGNVSVRRHRKGDQGSLSLHEFISQALSEISSKELNN
jgi:threonyl-tRNA synthetase